ncbi:MAG TPA: hypothetical protein VGP61_01030, partial [Gemmatimonadales bacterium]|nr:hypothetical protein [Gemmatimonadales bacterium]
MGLHICYELALPANSSRARVLALLDELRSKSARLPFDEVTGIREFVGAACETASGKESWNDPWVLFRVGALARAIAGPDEDHDRLVAPDYAVGFLVLPGRRCEPAAFGFSHLPAEAHVKGETLAIRHPGWHWHYCCKTQYASVVSEAHLLRCHLGLIAVLDVARGLGIKVTVRDETGYDQHRDEKKLLESVHAANRLIAGIAGRMADQLDPSKVKA